MSAGNRANGHGTYAEPVEVSMEHFDSCSPDVRAAIRGAVGCYAAKPIIDLLGRGYHLDEVVEIMAERDAMRCAALYGPEHPEARI